MYGTRSRLLLFPLLVLSVFVVSARSQGVIVKATIEAMAKDLTNGKKIDPADVKKFIARWRRWEDVMYVYKPAVRGQPGLELILSKLSSKKTYTAAEKAELQKIANLSRVGALLAPHYAPDAKKVVDPVKRKEWGNITADMKNASMDLFKAINANDNQKIRRAAFTLSGSCPDCHAKFRE